MAKPVIRTGISRFETLLLRHNVISGTFVELDHQKSNNVHNHRRLLLIVLTIVMFVRYMVITIFNNVKVSLMLGDVLWRLGVMGHYTSLLACITGVITTWYLIAVTYCEYHGQLGFLNDLRIETDINCDYSSALNTKALLLYKVLMFNTYVQPYVNAAGVLALCSWNAYHTDRSITQLLYNIVCSVSQIPWVNTVVVVISSVSALVYLSASSINQQLKSSYEYLLLCKDPFTLNRVLDEFTNVIVKVNEMNKFVKFVIGSVNFFAVPFVSIMLSVISMSYDGTIMKCFVFAAASSVSILLVSTAAFMASIHYKVRIITPNVLLMLNVVSS